jgi:peroxiredoxin
MNMRSENIVENRPFEAFTDEGVDVKDELQWDPSNKPFGENSLLPRFGGRYYDLASGRYKDFDSNSHPDQPLVVLSPTVFRDDSPDCRDQALAVGTELSALQKDGIQVIHVVSQLPDTVKPFVEKHGITHPVVSISRTTVYEMGLGIKPLTTPDGTVLAAVGYWGNGQEVTARTATVAGRLLDGPQTISGSHRRVLSHQRPQDQGAKLNFAKIRIDARAA